MTEIQILLTNWMSALAILLPFGYSFGAGMVSTVNPCGFSMLPAYLSLYLGEGEGGKVSSHFFLRSGTALLIGTAVTLGFTVLFSIFGVILWAGGHFLLQYLPWLGLFVGAVLTALALSIAVFKGGLATYLRRILLYMGRIAGFLLLISGSYQIYYWLTKGGLLA
jgi:cytochrome c biogenesis protein CcdA